MSKRMGHRSHRPASMRGSTPSTITITPTKGSVNSTIGTITEQDQPEMAASFLQFCATCESQIFTPSNSLLYCSEACRRKDSNKPLSLSAGAMPPTASPPTSAPPSPRPILPSRIPTGASYSSTASCSSRIPTDHHNARSDLDPTEWKPKTHRRGVSNTNSEAFRYLCRFHQSNNGTANPNGDDMAIERVQRPAMNNLHHSTTSITSLNTPSLAQTPTTASSSLSSISAMDYTNLTYDFNTRPLPPRHDPSYSSSAGAAKGIELVMPHVAPPATPLMAGSAPDHVQFHGGVWEKQTVRKLDRGEAKDGRVKEGLGALFGAGAVKNGEK